MAGGRATPTGVKRVKTGCVTCRIRRVKCDEERPECKKCTSTGRKCDGYSTLPFSRRDLQAAASSSDLCVRGSTSPAGHGLVPRLVTDPAFSDLLEKRYFQFFRQKTVQSTNSLTDSRFWDRVVLQGCHLEPTIKHAVLALSALHQVSALPDDSDEKRRHTAFTELQHQKALDSAKMLVGTASPQDLDRVLIACVLFVCYEGVRGDYRASHIHAQSGRAIILNNIQRLRHASRRSELAEIEHALARFDVPALTFQDSSTPARFNLRELRAEGTLEVPELESIVQARASLVDLTRWILVIEKPLDSSELPTDPAFLARCQRERMKCTEQLKLWRDRFETLVSAEQETEPLNFQTALLRIWHSADTAIVHAGLFGQERRWDSVQDRFEEIVLNAEKVVSELKKAGPSSFSAELGYLDSTFLVATRCRDPLLRRRALHVLEALPRQEGVWHSTPAAAIARRIIDIEEHGLSATTVASDVPDQQRVSEIQTAVNVGKGHVILRLVQGSPHTSQVVREEFVSWPRY